MALAGAGALAQESADSGVAAGAVSIRKIPTLNSVKQKTPQTFNAGVAPSRSKEWGVFDVEFDVKAPWVDDLSVSFFVMTQNPKDPNKQPFSFYQLTSRYRDVEKGQRKVSAVLTPAALARFGNVVGLAVEISAGGKVLDSKSVESPELVKYTKWWHNKDVTDGQVTVKRSGYLVERSKTPFGLVGYDDYEAEIQ